MKYGKKETARIELPVDLDKLYKKYVIKGDWKK